MNRRTLGRSITFIAQFIIKTSLTALSISSMDYTFKTHIHTQTCTHAHTWTSKRTGNTDEFSHEYSFSNNVRNKSARSVWKEKGTSPPFAPSSPSSFDGSFECHKGVKVCSLFMRASKLKLIKLLSGNFSQQLLELEWRRTFYFPGTTKHQPRMRFFLMALGDWGLNKCEPLCFISWVRFVSIIDSIFNA